MKKFKRIAALALALVMLVTALAGCGAKGKEELKGVTEDTILVGNTAGTTGALATIGGPFNIGIEAAFAAYNAAGGFNGKSVKLQHYDDGGVAANSVTLTEQLIHEDEVFAIVGNFASNCVAANLPVIKEANVPMVYAAAGNDELLNEKAEGAERGIFPVQPLNFTEGRMMILRAFAPADNGGLAGTKVGVLSNTVEASQTMLKGIQAEAAELGSKKDSIIYQNVTSSDYSAAVNALKNAGCNVVVVTVIGADFTSALTAMANANYYVPVLTSYNNANAGVLNDPATTLLASQYADVIANIPIFAQAWLDITSTEYYYNKADSALLKNYETMGLAQAGVGMPGFKEEYWAVAENIYNYCVGQGMANAFAMSYDSYALAGYIAGDLFCQGLKELQAKGKDLTRANYVDIMESKEFQVAMADKISFANGMRSGVQSFALTMFYDAFTVNNGAYHSAASVTVHGLTSIEEYRTLVKG